MNFEVTLVENVTHNNYSGWPVEEYLGPRRDSLLVVIPITVIYLVIFVTGLVGNVSTCIVISRNKSMHTATNYYLFSLAISDLLLLLSGLPQEVYSMWYRYPYIFGKTFCILRGLFAETSANATVLTITAFTVERYVAICHPFLSHTMSKLSRAVKLILVIWIFSICLATPQALQLDVYSLVDVYPSETIACYPKASDIMGHAYTISTVLIFVVPMAIITVLYVLIGMRLRGSSIIKKHSVPAMQTYCNNRDRNMKRSSSFRHQGQSSGRVVKMLVAVVVAFFICWAPFHIQRLFATYGGHILQTERGAKLYAIITYISGVFYYVSTTINPLLYNIMSNKFREAFKETFSRCCRMAQLKSGRPQRSYSVLSRSVQRGPESTDSGREEPTLQNNSSLTQKGSFESVAFHSTARSSRCGSRRHIERDFVKEVANCNSSTQTEWPSAQSDTNLALVTHPFKIDATHHVKNITVHIKEAPANRFKFWRMFHCISDQGKESNRRYSGYYSSPIREHNIFFELECAPRVESLSMSLCDISNSSLRDVEASALEDELTSYMKEIQQRELYNN